MTGSQSARSFPLTRRTFRVLRWVAPVVILFGPIAEAAWAVRATARMLVSSPEVYPASAGRPDIDTLLPEGSGGTHFFEDLGPNAGLAFAGAAAIALAASVNADAWPQSVELHERAHLLDAFRPSEVAGVMSRMTPPAPTEYAAKNNGEHFGEMAARAWEIVAPPDQFCVDGTPAQRLETAEARVPGTSGFVLRYLNRLPKREVEGDAALRATAERLSAPARDEWMALWRIVDDRRRPDGTLDPWPVPTIRAYLESRRTQARASDQLIDRFVGIALLPSLVIVRAAGG